MTGHWKLLDRAGIALRDGVLFLIGQRCLSLGDWPDRGVVEAATSVIAELGGQTVPGPDAGLAFDIENLYFRVRGRRVRLCIEEYGDVTLWGPKHVVTDLEKRIAKKLSARSSQSQG